MSFFDVVSFGLIWAWFMLSAFYMTAFLFHEFGHRQVALHFGLQTKFRLLTYGMIMTVITLGRMALPGAVVVLGLDKISRKTGLCKAAGPLVNLIYGSIIGYGAQFNFMLGLFNMIPLGILDGQNIWKWNKKVYFSLIIPLAILLIVTMMSISAPVSSNPYIPI